MNAAATASPHATVLADPAASLSDVMAAVKAVEDDGAERHAWRIGISANVTLDLLTTFLRRHALLHGATAAVEQGAYDAHAENVAAFLEAGVEHLLLVNLFDNLLPAFEARVETLDPELVSAQRDRVAAELALVLEAARPFKAVHLARFHRMTPTGPTAPSRRLDEVIASFNEALAEVAAAFANVELLDLGEVTAHVGLAHSFNPRFYARFKAPYAAPFCDELARRLALTTRAGGAYLRKVLALDCDNTLWGGVVGEDGLDGIRLGPHDHPGGAYWAAQQAFLALQRNGVLLCLCTKNNPEDVAEVLRSHPHQVLRDEHLIVQKVNWEDKVENLVAIAEELDLGLESFVFLDDSPFEAEAVRERLPQVRTFSVPRQIADYAGVVREISELFLAGAGEAGGGAEKTEQYRIRARAREEATRHATREDYLASLELKVVLRRDPRDAVPRIAQLTQKSNQFNLTTRRYTEAEILECIEDPAHAVYALHVSDRFGDAGLTGVLIARLAGRTAEIEAFLMSCRVIGRGIELSPWPQVVADARAAGCDRLAARWARTRKNAQVEDFYDRLGLPATEAGHGERRYEAPLDALDLAAPSHIDVEVRHG